MKKSTYKHFLHFAKLSELAYNNDRNFIINLLEQYNYSLEQVISMDSTDTEALICTSNNHRYVIFRGTESMEDWATNANIDQTTIATVNDKKEIKAHAGFVNAISSIQLGNQYPSQYEIVDHLQQKTAHDKKHLIFLGHSLGGALATITAYLCHLNGLTSIDYVCTFGSPRCGNKAFAEAFNRRLGSKTSRVCNGSDFVTNLPFDPSDTLSIIDWKHVGQKVQIGSSYIVDTISDHKIDNYQKTLQYCIDSYKETPVDVWNSLGFFGKSAVIIGGAAVTYGVTKSVMRKKP